ncbi:MAG: helix-turn-helix domain-containing protein [Bacteriovoracaceae bacterium]|nr:helix-turn-helix domain-containing protein [Bacteriovoracaceae bacterium]
MNIDEKMTLLLAVQESGFKVTEALKPLEVPRSTYYRWKARLKKEGVLGLEDKRPIPKKQ